MPSVKSVTEAPVAGKRVLLRAVINVPLQDGKVADETRLRALVPTLELLRERGAAAITIMGYVGRPHGKVVDELRVAPVEAALKRLTTAPFTMLENLRFDPREEANDESLAKELAAQGDVYVNDAFADSHRAYASIVGVPKLLPSYLGLHFAQEIAGITPALMPPVGSVAIIGGAKFETKLPLIQKLLGLYADVLLGGALGNDLIKARGMPFGDSMISPDAVPLEVAVSERLYAPTDAVVSSGAGTERIASVTDIRAHEQIIDIGPQTAELWAKKIATAPLVLWNGPMGIYERGYTNATDALAGALSKSGTHAVVGGGDTVASLKKFTFDPQKVFMSTGGGAMLEFLTHGTLPGLDALRN